MSYDYSQVQLIDLHSQTPVSEAEAKERFRYYLESQLKQEDAPASGIDTVVRKSVRALMTSVLGLPASDAPDENDISMSLRFEAISLEAASLKTRTISEAQLLRQTLEYEANLIAIDKLTRLIDGQSYSAMVLEQRDPESGAVIVEFQKETLEVQPVERTIEFLDGQGDTVTEDNPVYLRLQAQLSQALAEVENVSDSVKALYEERN
ncbi:MAG: hypothetical protein DHS20C12_12030 [Pseudohongiella sp.]|nr:MAG: hypothetical protein DHS20C12_12030 [Pseudohongiella sp.]